MDPITFLIIAFIVMEAADGGFLTANAAGAAAAGGRAAWRETSTGAKARYASRAKRMKKTAAGRAQLRTEAALAGLAAGVGKGLAAGVRAMPAGARQGRDVRKKALAAGRQKVATAVKVHDGDWFTDGLPDGWRGRVQRRGPLAQIEGWKLNPETGEWEREVAGAWRPARKDDQDQLRFWVNGAQWDPPAEAADPEKTHADDPDVPAPVPGRPGPAATETSPAPGGGKKEEPMPSGTTNDLSSVSEDRGVKPYVDAWDAEIGGMEQVVSDLSAIAERVAKAVEANARHDPAGAQDVAGALAAVVEAAQAAGEQIDGHAALLHQKWDGAIEQLQANEAESAQELVGSA